MCQPQWVVWLRSELRRIWRGRTSLTRSRVAQAVLGPGRSRLRPRDQAASVGGSSSGSSAGMSAGNKWWVAGTDGNPKNSALSTSRTSPRMTAPTWPRPRGKLRAVGAGGDGQPGDGLHGRGRRARRPKPRWSAGRTAYSASSSPWWCTKTTPPSRSHCAAPARGRFPSTLALFTHRSPSVAKCRRNGARSYPPRLTKTRTSLYGKAIAATDQALESMGRHPVATVGSADVPEAAANRRAPGAGSPEPRALPLRGRYRRALNRPTVRPTRTPRPPRGIRAGTTRPPEPSNWPVRAPDR